MTQKPDPATVSLASKKGAERADRLRARAQYLEDRATGFVAKAEASALRWVVARLGKLEADREQQVITQARAVELIHAWVDEQPSDGERIHLSGGVLLDGMDLDKLRIG